MVAALAVFLLLILKARMQKEESLPPPPAMTTAQSVEAVPAAKVPAGVSESMVTAPAVKTPPEEKKHSSLLLRDLFAPVNPVDERRLFGGGQGGTGMVLTALFLDDGDPPLAIINNKVLGEGETIGTARVVSIGKDRVVLATGKRTRTLVLKKADNDHE